MSNALVNLTGKLADRFGMGPESDPLPILKATAFKGPVTDAQMVSLLVVAHQYGLNPFTREIYAFPDKNNGIVPVVGVDGWSRIINENPQFDGMDFEQNEESCTCIIYRKDRKHPIKVTEYMSECKRDAGPWRSHPRRMLRHKAMIQCARLAFGFGGIYEPDEAERILDGDVPVFKSTKAATVAAQNEPEGLEDFEKAYLELMQKAAENGLEALEKAFNSAPASKLRTAFWIKHGSSLKEVASQALLIDAETGEIAQ